MEFGLGFFDVETPSLKGALCQGLIEIGPVRGLKKKFNVFLQFRYYLPLGVALRLNKLHQMMLYAKFG